MIHMHRKQGYNRELTKDVYQFELGPFSDEDEEEWFII
jgi:hypothetical protein